jgi:DNA polymerase (family 10)
LREDHGEIEAARAGRLPHLVTDADLRGDLHSHSDWMTCPHDRADGRRAPPRRSYQV